jgi:hypothetical protein
VATAAAAPPGLLVSAVPISLKEILQTKSRPAGPVRPSSCSRSPGRHQLRRHPGGRNIPAGRRRRGPYWLVPGFISAIASGLSSVRVLLAGILR